MSFNNVPAGKDLPQDFNVIIEIPAQSDPVKYEADKEMGLLVVDRFIGTGMRYPANYGFIPQTLSGDGEALGHIFDITPSGTIGHWQLVLQPRDHTEHGLLQWMRISGYAGRITTIDTANDQGDRSEMAIVEQSP